MLKISSYDPSSQFPQYLILNESIFLSFSDLLNREKSTDFLAPDTCFVGMLRCGVNQNVHLERVQKNVLKAKYDLFSQISGHWGTWYDRNCRCSILPTSSSLVTWMSPLVWTTVLSAFFFCSVMWCSHIMQLFWFSLYFLIFSFPQTSL